MWHSGFRVSPSESLPGFFDSASFTLDFSGLQGMIAPSLLTITHAKKGIPVRTIDRVPSIDMAQATLGRNPAFVEELGQACEHIGFAVLTNHGLDPALLKQMYAAMEKLFSLPLEALQRYETPHNFRQTGYTSPLIERAVGAPQSDLKAFYHVRRELPPNHPGRERPAFIPNIWPDEVPEFRELSLALFDELDRLAMVTLRALSLYLGLPEDELPNMVVDGESLLRQLYYMPVDPELARQGFIRAGAHEDINLVTLLVAATEPGLEVKPREGDWFPVNEMPGSIVLNVGDMLQLYTKGRLVSTTHRVVNQPGSDFRARYSLPFFAHPRAEVILDPERQYTAGAYLAERLSQIGLAKA